MMSNDLDGQSGQVHVGGTSHQGKATMTPRRAHGRDRRSRLVRTALGLVLLVSVTGAAAAVSTSASAYSPRLPKISASAATFNIPTGNGKNSVFTLELWSHGTLEGSVQGTSGLLTVAVLPTADCTVQADVFLELQADVYVGAPGGHGAYYSGLRVTLRDCASTIAGDIDLCSASGAPTATEVGGGSLTATGPEVVSPRPNPMAPIRVPAGTYTMTAGAPPGYVLVACGGAAAVGSDGGTASEPVVVTPGTDESQADTGTGAGVFYVMAATAPGTGGGSGSGTAGGSGAAGGATASQTSAATAALPAVGASTESRGTSTAPVAATAAGSSALAFTGMNTGPPLLLGLLLLFLGFFLTTASRRRRRVAVAARGTSGRRS
jgi:hypothetical protein